MSAASLFDLSGKTALVTGTSGGLGLGMARALANAGADIVGLGPAPMPAAAETIRSLGRRWHEVVADLSKPQDYGALVAGIERDAAPIDILVNNAGIIRRADVLDFTEEDWDAVMTVNLKAMFLITQAVARSMVARGCPGRIVSVASMLSFQGGIRVPSYTASKHGVAGLTKLFANELAPKGITVNAIAPGYMATDNTAALQADPVRNRAILDRIPAGRWGTPADLQGAVVFLAAPASDYMHGHVLAVDGGWLVR